MGTTDQGAPPSLGAPRWVIPTWWPRRPWNWRYKNPYFQKKNHGERIIMIHEMEPPSPPVLHREARSGVRLGLRRGGSSFFIITNPSPSPISWCSPPGVSNSVVGLLVDRWGVGWDSSCNRVNFVRASSLVSTMFLDWCCYDFAMLNACHFGPECHVFRSEPFMLSPLYPCSRSDLASYSHLLCVMIQ